MTLLLLIFYFIFFCAGFRIYNLPQRVGLPFGLICFLFGFKILFGIINLYFHNSEYLNNDAHFMYVQAMLMLDDFAQQPMAMLGEWLFNWGDIHEHFNFFKKGNAVYWSDIGRLMHQRFMVLCAVLSFGCEYVTVLFYNMLYFIGLLALYKSFTHFRPNQKWLFIILIFFIPSVAFWTSGIHKDGLILSLVGMVSWASIKLMDKKHWKNFILLGVLLIFLFGVRYFYFLVFLPFYITFWLTRKNKKPFIAYAVVAFLGIVCFLFSGYINKKTNFLSLVVNKQQEFLSAKGYSDMATPLLDETPRSFMRNFPVAMQHIFIEPIPQIGYQLKYDITAIDALLVLIALLIAIWRLKRKYLQNSFFYLLFFYSIFCLAFIGYTIPNLGALVRYESPFICLQLLCLFAMGDASLKKLPLK